MQLVTPDRTLPFATRAGVALLVAAVFLAAGSHGARAASFSQTLGWGVSGASMWSAGGGSAGFDVSGSTGNVDLVLLDVGLTWDFGASSGSVDANVAGKLTASYDDTLAAPGSTQVTVGFKPASSSFSTSVGANADLDFYTANVPWPFSPGTTSLLDQNYSLDTSKSFTSTLGTKRSDSDAFAATGLGVSLVIAGADADLNITQTANFRPDAVDGVLRATNADTGTMVQRSFVLDAAMGTSVLDLDLDEAGTWDVDFFSLDLLNTFWTTIGASITATAWYDIGLSSGSATIPIGAISLFNSPTFALALPTLSAGGFSISVVPEPGTLLLAISGILGLAVFGRQRRAPLG